MGKSCSITFRPLRNPDVRCKTFVTLGLAALFARCGDGNGVVILSLFALPPVHSLQLNSEADLLKCFLNDEQRDSKLNFAFSVESQRKER
jgi:hypothetical protein